MNVRWLTAFIDRPPGMVDVAARFWAQVTGTSLSAGRGEHGEFASLVPDGADPWLRVQRVQEGDGGHHLDLHLDVSTDLAGAAAQAAALGAELLHAEDDLRVLRSPAGFVFCLGTWCGEAHIGGPVVVPGAGTSRVDQLCIDIPPGDYAAECAFWSQLTGWPVLGLGGEFRRLDVPDRLPLKLLLQRLDDVRPGQRATAHLDAAAGDDAGDLAAWQETLGAFTHGVFDDWVAMYDPTGVPYCLTRRQPE